jgi:ABC-2 type transport system permease protein
MRYLSLLLLQLRKSVTLAMQYRWDFAVSVLLSVLWIGMALVPFYVAFHGRPPVSGWTYESALVVVGWFTLLRGVLDGAINPSLLSVVGQIRDGTLDFVLLKPADAQFLVSTARFEVFRMADMLAGAALVAAAFLKMGRAPSAGGVLLALVMLGAATVVIYSIWILVVAAAFWVVKLDNLTYLFDSLFDFARWPVTIFKGMWYVFFTFVIPLGVMTTYPAQALLGTLGLQTAVGALVGSLALAVAARFVWRWAIGHYTSASS